MLHFLVQPAVKIQSPKSTAHARPLARESLCDGNLVPTRNVAIDESLDFTTFLAGTIEDLLSGSD